MLLGKGGKKMLNRLGSHASRAQAPVEENPAPDAFNSTGPADFNRLSDEEIERVIALYRLSGDEIERTIALYEAPRVVWRPDPASAHAPEPLGMIA
jgi:hypothetical protein